MKMAMFNLGKKNSDELNKFLTSKGIFVIENDKDIYNYDDLLFGYEHLSNRTIDYLMLGDFQPDFNFCLDFLPAKILEKQKFGLIGNKYSTSLLNYVSMLNNKNKIIYGSKMFDEIDNNYQDLANIISISRHEYLVADISDNPNLIFCCQEKVVGDLIGGYFDSLMDVFGTKYFPKLLKNKILLIDGLSHDVRELRRQITMLSQRGILNYVKAIIFGVIKGVDLQKYLEVEFERLLVDLPIVFNFEGIDSKNQACVLIGAKTIIIPKEGIIIQE